jgi:pilus assembly protein CpaD
MTAKKPWAARSAIALSLGFALSGCIGGSATNRMLESVHQPVVERQNYTLDVTTGPGGMSLPEQRRLAGWFEAMDLRYGDRVTIDDPLKSPATRAAVEAVVARYGLLVGNEAPATAGYVNAGSSRIVLTRSTASVPGCPDWSAKSDANFKNATGTNYGCASNANLAAMVANPEHLLKGEEGTGETTIMGSTKAIEAFRQRAPTGEGGLKQISTSSGK